VRPRNFAYLMVADDAVRSLPEVSTVDGQLEDYFAAVEINAGVAGSFRGEAVAELDEPRRNVSSQGVLAALDRLATHVELDLPCAEETPSLLDENGAAAAPPRLRFARAVSVDSSAGLCRSFLHTRYPEAAAR